MTPNFRFELPPSLCAPGVSSLRSAHLNRGDTEAASVGGR